MRHKFCAMIASYKRPGKVVTAKALRDAGYTGEIFVVVSDDDPCLPDYAKTFGDRLLVFSKSEASRRTDLMDNDPNWTSVLFARVAMFELAKNLGFDYFLALDDDYKSFHYRYERCGSLKSKAVRDADALFDLTVDLLNADERIRTVAFAQGGDWVGGLQSDMQGFGIKRKAMNTFFCRVHDEPFFLGRINEDVNAYSYYGNLGEIFLQLNYVSIVQTQTMSSSGGLTDVYVQQGKFVKSFYTVMLCPSAVGIGHLGQSASTRRLHHSVRWGFLIPKIIRPVPPCAR